MSRHRVSRLRRDELPVDTVELARDLIGKSLVRETPQGRMSGRIVETEAYLPGDAAAHSFRGKTPRNRSLFLERGHAYVYFIYGCWFSMNVSGDAEGVGAGVLLRALEPIEGVAIMRANRGVERVHDLARGPGRLAAALAIDRTLDGIDLCGDGPLWLGCAPRACGAIGTSTRVGITLEAQRPLRFYERGNRFVSGTAKMRV